MRAAPDSDRAGVPRLEEAVLAALEAVRVRRPSRLPHCPVCGAAMRRVEDADAGAALRCVDCASVLADLHPAADAQLRMVS